MGLLFGKEVYLNRMDKCRLVCSDRGLDGLVVFGKEPDRLGDIKYLTHYHPWLGGTPTLYEQRGRGNGALILPLEGEPVLVASSHYYGEVAIDDVRVGVNLTKKVCDVLQEMGLEQSRLGLVGGDALYVVLYQDLLSWAPRVQWTLSDDIVRSIRAVKSPEELAILREGCRKACAVAEIVCSAAEPGVTERELALLVMSELAKLGVSEPFATCQSGVERSGEPLARPMYTDRVIEDGDMFHIEICGVYNHYLVDICRAGVAGKASKKQIEILGTVLEMGQAIARKAAPGVRAEELQTAAGEIAVAKGYGRFHTETYGGPGSYVGHGMGFGYDDIPVLAKGDKTVLREGMVLAVEPGLYRTSVGGARIERNIVITDKGSEYLGSLGGNWW
ncbi:MAG: aminopeptidase P family protein [Deltaproteobacteria bacterium]|nr:aminopeptidase P family protein [Deltaproteobacteria bacterium]